MKNFLLAVPLMLFSIISSGRTNVPGLSDSSTIPPYYKYGLHSRLYLSLLTSYNFGQSDYAEPGLALYQFKRTRKNSNVKCLYIADEIKINHGSDVIMGPKIGAWTSNGMAAGASIIYYTDFTRTSLRFRPEVGIGTEGFKLSYGYNIPITDEGLIGVSNHVVSLSVLWKLAKLKERKVENDWNPRERKEYMARKHEKTLLSLDHAVLLAGIHGWKYTFGELGIAYHSRETATAGTNMSFMLFLSSEFKLSEQVIGGPKLGMYISGVKKFGIGGGVSMIYLTGMKNSSLMARPELGVHFGMLRVSYGYNHVITNHSYDAVSRHNVSAVFGLKLGKGKSSDRVRSESKGF